MNWDEIEGNWTQFKGKVRLQWGKLTDDDLHVVKGKRDELLGLLQKRQGASGTRARSLGQGAQVKARPARLPCASCRRGGAVSNAWPSS